MKPLQIQTDLLESALAAVSRFVSPRSPNLAYTKVRLVSNGSLCLLAGNANGNIEVDTGVACDEMDAIVDFMKFQLTTRALNSGEVFISIVADGLMLKAGKSEVKLPISLLPWAARLSDCKDSIEVGTDAFHERSARISYMENVGCHKIAHGQRLLIESGTLYLLSSSGDGIAGESMGAKGTIDVVVPHEALFAATSALRKMDQAEFKMKHVGGTLCISSDIVKMTLVTCDGGMPPKKSVFNKITSGSFVWDVPQCELVDFLRQASIFVEEWASSVLFTPTADGLLASFCAFNEAGVPVEGGTCSTLIPGHFEGGPAKISHKHMQKMVSQCSVDYKLMKGERSLAVESGTYFATYALRVM